jgi:hypothetical protein
MCIHFIFSFNIIVRGGIRFTGDKMDCNNFFENREKKRVSYKDAVDLRRRCYINENGLWRNCEMIVTAGTQSTQKRTFPTPNTLLTNPI